MNFAQGSDTSTYAGMLWTLEANLPAYPDPSDGYSLKSLSFHRSEATTARAASDLVTFSVTPAAVSTGPSKSDNSHPVNGHHTVLKLGLDRWLVKSFGSTRMHLPFCD